MISRETAVHVAGDVVFAASLIIALLQGHRGISFGLVLLAVAGAGYATGRVDANGRGR